MRNKYVLTVSALTLTLAATATGCNSFNAAPPRAAPVAERTPIAAVPSSPLDEFLAFISWEAAQAELARNAEAGIARMEELTAQCMQDRGFEYVPYLGEIPGWGRPFTSFLSPQSDNPDWIAEFGFGFFAEPSLVSIGFGAPMEIAGLHYESDPNFATFSSLTPEGQREWRRALIGRQPWEGDDWGGGCRNAASEIIQEESQINQAMSLLESPEFEAVNAALSEMRQNLMQAGPPAEEQDWLECMATAGYPEMIQQFEDTAPRFAPELNGFFSFAHDARVYEQLRREFVDIVLENHEATGSEIAPTPAESPAMADLQRREIALALADFNCRVATNFEARQAERRIEAETQFVRDHHAALVALRDTAEQRGLTGH